MSGDGEGDDGAKRGQAKGSGGTKGRGGSGGRTESSLLQALRDEAARLGTILPEGWTVTVRPRPNSTGSDPYYISPEGKRYRSRQEVFRAVGVNKGKSRAEAAETAAKALAATQLPLVVGHLAVTTWGVVDSRPGFHQAHVLFPVGYTATWRESGAEGRTFVSAIQADELLQRPVFTVRLAGDQPVGGAGPDATTTLAEGFSPQAAWACAHRLWNIRSDDDSSAAPTSHDAARWTGGEHFGLRLAEVGRCLEGLPGVDIRCPGYVFVEQYTDWDAEAATRARLAARDANGAEEGQMERRGRGHGGSERRITSQRKAASAAVAAMAAAADPDSDDDGDDDEEDEGEKEEAAGGAQRPADTAPATAVAMGAGTTGEDTAATAPPATPALPSFTAVADERARVSAMDAAQRAAYLASLSVSTNGAGDHHKGGKGKGAAGGGAPKGPGRGRGNTSGADKTARAVAKAEQRTAKDAAKVAARERAAADREREAGARARRARYPVDDDLVPAMEQADAAAEGRVYVARPDKPVPKTELPQWTGDVLAVCSFFEARVFTATSDLAPVLRAPPPALPLSASPTALMAALHDPGRSPLLYEMYAALLRTLINVEHWQEPGGAAAAVAAAAAASARVPPHWLRTANRAGFASFPELLRRWLVHGPRNHLHGSSTVALAERLCAHGPGGLDAQQHVTLLHALCDDVLECGSSRSALDESIDKRMEAARAAREEVKTARDAARVAEEAVNEAKRKRDAIESAPGGGEDDDEDYTLSDGEGGGKKQGRPTPRKTAQTRAEEMADAQDALAAAQAAAQAAAADLAAVEAKHNSVSGAASAQLPPLPAHVTDVVIRRAPLGTDAAHVRYWWLRTDPVTLYVERPGELDVCAGDSTASWASYTHPADVSALMTCLNPHGVRESGLLDALQKGLPHMQAAAMPQEEGGAAGAPAEESEPMTGVEAGAVAGVSDDPATAAAPDDAELFSTSFEAAALGVCSRELLPLIDCIVAANDPPPSAAMRDLAACLRQHRDGSNSRGRIVIAPGVARSRSEAVKEVALGVLAFEDEVCRAHDPRAAGFTKAAARAAELAARKAARAEEAAAMATGPAAELVAAEGLPPQPVASAMEVDDDGVGDEEEGMEEEEEDGKRAPEGADDDEAPVKLETGPPARMLDEAVAEYEEWHTVETKPSGGIAKPKHPPLWRHAKYRDAWRAALTRCVEAPCAAGPLAYAVASLAERSARMMTSMAPKEYRKRPQGMPPPRAPLLGNSRTGLATAALDEALFDEDAVVAAINASKDGEGDVPKYLLRDTLEALFLQHLGRDISRQKLAKHKIARALPPDVLRAAVAKAAAEFRSRGGRIEDCEPGRKQPSRKSSKAGKRAREESEDYGGDAGDGDDAAAPVDTPQAGATGDGRAEDKVDEAQLGGVE